MLTALRHRPHAERRVLMLLRGGLLTASLWSRRINDMPEPTPAQLRRFADLRRVALAYGLAIQPPERPYVGEDELRLLAWLAEAQRIAGPDTAPDAPDLRAALAACAALLDGMGLRLTPLTLMGARLRQLTG
jgi:hypothetical protein